MLSRLSRMSLINPTEQIRQWIFQSVSSIEFPEIILDFKRLFERSALNEDREAYSRFIKVIK